MTVYGCAGYGRPIGGAVTDGIEAVHSLETIDDQGLSVPPPPFTREFGAHKMGFQSRRIRPLIERPADR